MNQSVCIAACVTTNQSPDDGSGFRVVFTVTANLVFYQLISSIKHRYYLVPIKSGGNGYPAASDLVLT